MHTYGNINLIGSSHISEESIRQVKAGFENVKPDIAAVELDSGRAQSLFEKREKPGKLFLLKSLGLGGFLFYVIGEFIQKNLGKVVNIEPGSEMKTTIILAKEANIMVALIDREIGLTLSRFSKNLKKREVLRLVWDIFFGKKEKIEFDISRVPSEKVIDAAIGQIKKRYPSICKVLIGERDIFMARQLAKLSKENPGMKILAVVGAGHVKGILKHLEGMDSKF